MTIEKFKTFTAAERKLWTFQPDQQYYRNLSALFDLAEKLHAFKCPGGIYKYTTLKEAQRERRAWEFQQARENTKEKGKRKK